MTWEAENGGGRQAAAPGAAVIDPELEAVLFSDTFERLRSAVRTECAGQSQWQDKISTGLRVVLEFVAREPTAARRLTKWDEGPDSRADTVIAYFSDLLGRAAPEGRPFGVSTDQAIVESLAGVVRAHIRAGTTDRLPAMAPELSLFALLPYTGSGAVGAPESKVSNGAVH